MTGHDIDGDRHPVEVLAEDFLNRQRRGEAPTVDEYVQAHPELADEIRDLFPAMTAMEDLKRVHSSSSGTRPVKAPTNLERLGDFRIVEEVGRGGMGIVYEAVQESLGRSVAVKVLPGQTILDEGRRNRFHPKNGTRANRKQIGGKR